MNRKLKCAVEREDDLYVSYCEGLGIASQGETIDEAKKNLEEAIEMFFEDAPVSEISGLLSHLKPSSPEEIQHLPEVRIAQYQQDPATQWELEVAQTKTHPRRPLESNW